MHILGSGCSAAACTRRFPAAPTGRRIRPIGAARILKPLTSRCSCRGSLRIVLWEPLRYIFLTKFAKNFAAFGRSCIKLDSLRYRGFRLNWHKLTIVSGYASIEVRTYPWLASESFSDKVFGWIFPNFLGLRPKGDRKYIYFFQTKVFKNMFWTEKTPKFSRPSAEACHKQKVLNAPPLLKNFFPPRPGPGDGRRS